MYEPVINRRQTFSEQRIIKPFNVENFPGLQINIPDAGTALYPGTFIKRALVKCQALGKGVSVMRITCDNFIVLRRRDIRSAAWRQEI